MFQDVKRGFRNVCWPMLVFYGCQLKGPYVGQLLGVEGCDANNGAYKI